MPYRVMRKKIGELLIERRIINEKQLNITLEELKKKGGYLSQHLIAAGFVTEEDIAVCLSNQYNFAYLPLENYVVPQEVLELIPLKWIRIYTLLPVDRVGDTLSVAMADPLNEGVIQMLQQITHCEIMVFISTYSELNAAINKYFREKIENLEKQVIEPGDMDKIKTATQFVQTKAYLGQERREYIRVRKELDITFYYHDLTYHGKTYDISYGGVSFVSERKSSGDVSFFSDVFMPINTSLACKIHLKQDQPPIDAVIKVLRVQVLKGKTEIDSKELAGQRYEIAGMFEFIDNEDRMNLVSLIKKEIK